MEPIISELLGKYITAELSVIWERNENIRESTQELYTEAKQYILLFPNMVAPPEYADLLCQITKYDEWEKK